MSLETPSGATSWSSKGLDQIFRSVTLFFALAVAGILLGLIGMIMGQAWPAIETFGWQFWLTTSWDPVQEKYGALPVILGTLLTSFLALSLAVPLGVGTAIFLSEDFLPLSLRSFLGVLITLLAAIPSVVYGLWGIYVLVPLLKDLGLWLHTHLGGIPIFGSIPVGPGLLPAAVLLAVMILPIITALAREAFIALPLELRLSSLGLGATRWETLFRILLPAAAPGISGGILLALGRAMGETMAVTMVIGNRNQLPISWLAPANTIASLLANQFPEARGLQISALMYAALILLTMTLIITILAESFIHKNRL
jgi:phosphate transport system permease protein